MTDRELEADVNRLIVESIVRLNKLMEHPDHDVRVEAAEALLGITVPDSINLNFTIAGPFSGDITSECN